MARVLCVWEQGATLGHLTNLRLPIEVAMQITGREWQNPAAARAKLIERVEKATYVPPPPPPKPSAFE